MTTIGWILMLAAWTAITVTLIYCMSRVLTTHREANGEDVGHMLGGAEEPPHE